jgi:hypothetical protein
MLDEGKLAPLIPRIRFTESSASFRQIFAVSGICDKIGDAILLDKTDENLLPFCYTQLAGSSSILGQ